MFGTRSLAAVLNSQLDVLLEHVPGVRDGDEAAIHDARVATRRLREALELTGAVVADELADVAATLRVAGRTLGTARDADVIHNLLVWLDTRFPLTATGRLRTVLAKERQLERRRLVKELERLNVTALRERLAAARVAPGLRERIAPRWRQALRAHIGARSRAVREAVYHSSGIYFPNRSHEARVAIKKLRYSLELADTLGLWHPARAVRRLKRVQDALGDAHDRQEAIARFEALDPPGAAGRTDIDLAVRILEAEILQQHQQYADRRGELIAICDACDRFATPRRASRSLLAAGLALPSLVMLGRRTRSAASNPREGATAEGEDVRIKIPVS